MMTAQRQSNRTGLILLDVLLINGAFYLSYLIRYHLEFPYPVEELYFASYTPFVPYAALLTFLCLLLYRIDGLYDQRRRILSEIYRLASSTMTAIVLTMAVTFILQPLYYSRGMLILAGAIIVVILTLSRIINNSLVIARHRRGIGVRRLLVVGVGEMGRAVIRTIIGNPTLGYQIVGYVDDDPAKGNGELGRIKGLGGIDEIGTIILDQDVDDVIVTLPWMTHRKIIEIVEQCERENVRVRIVPDMFQQRMHQVDLDSLNGIPLIGSGPSRMGSSAILLKRVIDLTLTILAMPVLLLLFLIVAIAIKLDSPGPVIYKQRRVGKDGREFLVYKFRSMIEGADQMKAELADQNEADGPLFKIKNDPRITRVGQFIRRTSVDEIPQLINVIRGEMSLVGPRPGTPDEVADYDAWQVKRLNVRPGITGLAQISGRSNLPFAETCLLDIFYIENWSLDLEIRILLQTIPRVITGSGAY